jgi:hypothetical protein
MNPGYGVPSSHPDCTNVIRLFAECSLLSRVFFIEHLAKQSLLRTALGKVLLSVTTTFTESRTLGKNPFSVCQALDESRRSAKGRQ